MKRASTFLLALVLVPALGLSPASAASPSSEEAEQRAVLVELDRLSAASKLQSVEGKAIRTGEASDWIGPDLEGGLAIDKLIQISPQQAVARTPAGKVPQDTYTYLEKVDGRWKVSAERTLALTGLLKGFEADLEAKPGAIADQEVVLRNIRLAVGSDAELTAWFAKHGAELEALKNIYVAAGPQEYWTATRGNKASPLSDRLRALGLAAIGRAESGFVEVIVGGILDNSVGFLFAGAQSPPQPSPDDYIWLEPMGSGWYLFRTT